MLSHLLALKIEELELESMCYHRDLTSKNADMVYPPRIQIRGFNCARLFGYVTISKIELLQLILKLWKH